MLKISGSIVKKAALFCAAAGVIGYYACIQKYPHDAAETQMQKPAEILVDKTPKENPVDEYTIYISEIHLESSLNSEYSINRGRK